jgi:hypothetical protein
MQLIRHREHERLRCVPAQPFEGLALDLRVPQHFEHHHFLRSLVDEAIVGHPEARAERKDLRPSAISQSSTFLLNNSTNIASSGGT